MKLPLCLAAALGELFPSLQWRRVAFFVGIRWPFNLGEESAIALPAGLGSIHICFRADAYEPDARGFFLLCAHELVHALQAQSSALGGRGLGLLNAFALGYLTSFLRLWSAAPGRGNRYEDEAYAYEALLDRALGGLPPEQRLPCLAGGGANPAYAGAAALAAVDPRVVKRAAEAKGLGKARLFSFGLARGGAAARFNAAGWCLLGACAGAIAGGPAGAALGAAAGAAAAAIDELTGLPSAVAAAIVLAIGAVVDAIAGVVRLAARRFDRPAA